MSYKKGASDNNRGANGQITSMRWQQVLWVLPLVVAAAAALGEGTRSERLGERRRRRLPHQHHRQQQHDSTSSESGRRHENVAADLQHRGAQVVQPKIVGGSTVPTGTYPFFAFALGDSLCGGSLIHDDIIMTAAHCLAAVQAQVAIGTSQVNNFGSPLDGEIRDVAYVVAHPDYVGDFETEGVRDIMLMKLATPSTQRPIGLTDSDPTTGASLTVIGFGSVSDTTQALPTTLQQVNVPVLPDNECEFAYAGTYGSQYSPSLMFCAGDVDVGGKDSCQGDSGGPIFADGSNSGDYVQMGIVSYGLGCGDPAYPGVYTQVSAFASWINEMVCTMTDVAPTTTNTSFTCPDTGAADPSTVPTIIAIYADDYPRENSWTVTNATGSVVAASLPNRAPITEDKSERVLYLLPGNYLFTFVDTEQDGICCDYGRGNITISVVDRATNNATVLVTSNGIFGAQLVLPLSIGTTSTGGADGVGNGSNNGTTTGGADVEGNGNNNGTITTTATAVTAQLQVTYDNWPEDITWSIINDAGRGATVISGPESLPSRNQTVTTEVVLLPGTYEFLILDSYGDGLCCLNGNGSYQIALQYDGGRSEVVVQSDGVFTAQESSVFVVPDRRQHNCSDSSATIAVTDTSRQPCSWLATNMDGYGYLCSFLDVSSACPATCGVCYDLERAAAAATAAATTNATTSANACADTKSGTVPIAAVGDVMCEWLAARMERFGYACTQTTVALHCPTTCNVNCSELLS